MKLSRRELHFLTLLYPNGTIGMGTEIGEQLYYRGLVGVVKFGRYGLTDEGREVIRDIAREAGRKWTAWRDKQRKKHGKHSR